jgi:hypothetical protein
MSQDYFLKKTYDAVYRASRSKTPFRTLSESYRLVLEEKSDIPFDINKVKSDITPWTVEQSNLSPELKDPNAKEEKGKGPGEYAVASVVSGLTDYDSVASMVQGGGESFDVGYPPGKENPKYKFEVKFFKDKNSVAQISKHGINFRNYVLEEARRILGDIYNEYMFLDDDDRNTVNLHVIDNIGVRDDADWSLEKYLKNYFLDNISTGGLNFNVLFKGKRFNKTKSGFHPLISAESLIEILDTITGKDEEENKEEFSKENPRVVTVKTTLKDLYGVNNSEKGEKLNKQIDREAEHIDRKFIKIKSNITGEKVTSVTGFYKQIKKLNLSKRLSKLKKELSEEKNLRSLFPSSLSGLFLVYPEGYRYIPETDIKDYIKITTISRDKFNITFKSPEHEA